ncbi:TIR domain-containing protein [Terricaulis sp.]|uniref:TIR domain-containing protein n=1 Tax=Terricaulis sp. TaxID=2768686 RepID=UPI002AC61D3B|nr:TIR domain-containing protein [Terricaulis sp.]MDZ4690118.1 TIR domain-containing protein [Terricaulis sp.]
MTSGAFEYWQPGSEERQLRIFVSHRYGKDQALYDEVIRALESNGFSVQDMSLSADQIMAGPRGGDLPKLKIQGEIAARIYTSDALIAPSRPAVTRSQWVSWEVQLAAIGYGLPILFVNEKEQQRRTRLVSEVADLGLPHAVCARSTQAIVERLISLIEGRPTWGMRQEETEKTIKFRGPPAEIRNEVLKRFPFHPRLPPAPYEPRARRGFWSFLSGDQGA